MTNGAGLAALPWVWEGQRVLRQVQSALLIRSSAFLDSTNRGSIFHLLNPWRQNTRIWRADSTTQFYTRDLSIRGFRCPQGVWNHPPWIMRDDCIILSYFTDKGIVFQWVLSQSHINIDIAGLIPVQSFPRSSI